MTGCPFYFICLVCTRQIGETPGESATRKCSAKLHFHFALRCKAASAHASGLLTQTPALPDFPAKLSTGQIFSPRPALRFALNRSVPSRHAPGRFRDCGRGQRLLASGLSRPFEKGRRKLLSRPVQHRHAAVEVKRVEKPDKIGRHQPAGGFVYL